MIFIIIFQSAIIVILFILFILRNNDIIYQHYKGGLYKYIGEGKHSETQEDMVIYKSLKDGQIWIRPTEMFYDYVTIDDKYFFERFKIVSGSSFRRK